MFSRLARLPDWYDTTWHIFSGAWPALRVLKKETVINISTTHSVVAFQARLPLLMDSSAHGTRATELTVYDT